MSRQTKKSYVSPEEYLAFERAAEYRNEYFDGEVFAMTGASRRHNLIAGNIGGSLWQQLRGKPCEVYPSDMRVRIPSANVYMYPDVVAVCGEPQFEDDYVDTLLNPTLLVEILSKSTASYDLRVKSGHYRTLPSLTEYLFVAQNEYHVALHIRQADGRWLLADIRGSEERVELTSVGCVLSLADVYERVEM
jgi:Uma2 family endonuclease